MTVFRFGSYSGLPALILVFLFLSLSIAISGNLYYQHQKEYMKRATENELLAIADMKVDQIAAWRRDRVADAAVISETPFIAHRIHAFFENPSDPGLKGEINAWMGAVQKNNQYRRVYLLDRKGRVWLSVPQPDKGFGACIRQAALEAMGTKKTVFADLHRKEGTEEIHCALLAPLLMRERGKAFSIGAVALEIDPHLFLYPLIQSWPMPSATAETLLIRQEGDEIVYLNDLRHRKNTALSLRFPMSRTQLPAVAAVRGASGIAEGIDYRGVTVIAATRPVRGSLWFIVAKQDRDEVDGPIRERAGLVAATVGILIVSSGVVSGLLWQRRSRQFDRKEHETLLIHLALVCRYEHLTRYANDIILVTDEEDRIVDANERALVFYGYDRDELFQRTMRAISTSEAAQTLDSQLEEARERDGMVFETVHQRKDGTTCPVQVSSRPIDIEGTNLVQSIIRDITERRQTERELEKYRGHLEDLVKERTAELVTTAYTLQQEVGERRRVEEEIRRLNEELRTKVVQLNATNLELEAFAYSVSHDLRAPLRSIDGFSQALLDDYLGLLGEDGRDCLRRIRGASQRMGRLIDDLLNLSRVTRVEMQPETIDLSAVVQTVEEELKGLSPKRQVDVVVAPGVEVKGDCSLLRIAMGNLLDNAFKFTRHIIGRPRIEFGLIKGDEDGPIYFVADNGAGFDMAYAGKLFAPFQRLHPSSEFEGTGIGLATVQRIIHRHGGKLWAEADIGKGATFYFTIQS